jgi:hypothetical protein
MSNAGTMTSFKRIREISRGDQIIGFGRVTSANLNAGRIEFRNTAGETMTAAAIGELAITT